MRPLLPLVVALSLTAGACSAPTSTIAEPSASVSEVEALEPTTSTSTTGQSTSDTATSDAAASDTATSELEPPEAEPLGPPADCRVISAFDSDGDRAAWDVVNDDVMGGRSSGERRYVDDVMIFEGSINTDGGGFSSLRRPVEVGALEGFRTLVVQAEADGRSYMITAEDQLDGRNVRVSHRSVLIFDASGRAAVDLADMIPAIFGQPVDDAAIEPGLVDEIGLMISDGVDGPFRIEVSWIAACP